MKKNNLFTVITVITVIVLGIAIAFLTSYNNKKQAEHVQELIDSAYQQGFDDADLANFVKYEIMNGEEITCDTIYLTNEEFDRFMETIKVE